MEGQLGGGERGGRKETREEREGAGTHGPLSHVACCMLQVASAPPRPPPSDVSFFRPMLKHILRAVSFTTPRTLDAINSTANGHPHSSSLSSRRTAVSRRAMHRKSQSVSSLSTLLGPDAGADSNASAASSSRARMRSSQGPVRSSRAPALGGPSERVGGEGRLARLPGLSESGERADRSPRTDTASGLARASSTRRKEERARHPASGLKRSSTVSSRLGEGGRARESSGSSVETAIYRGVPGEAGARDEVRASMSGMAARRAVVRESNISEDSAVRPSINSSSGAALGTYNHPVSVPTPGPIQPSTPRTAARAGTHHVSGSTPRRSRASRTDGEATPRSRREESRASGPHARRSARHMAESIDEEIGRALYMVSASEPSGSASRAD